MSKHLSEAIDDLAKLFEFGALQVATGPATFIDTVADEIKRLRRERYDAQMLIVTYRAALLAVRKLVEERTP